MTERLHFHALEKEVATHSSVLAWRIPGMGEPGGLLSMASHRVGHDWSDLAATLFYFICLFGCVGSWLWHSRSSSCHGGFSSCVLSLEHVGSVVVALGLFSDPLAYGILVPWPEIEPVSPALEGGFLTAGPQGSPCSSTLEVTGLGFTHLFSKSGLPLQISFFFCHHPPPYSL